MKMRGATLLELILSIALASLVITFAFGAWNSSQRLLVEDSTRSDGWDVLQRCADDLTLALNGRDMGKAQALVVREDAQQVQISFYQVRNDSRMVGHQRVTYRWNKSTGTLEREEGSNVPLLQGVKDWRIICLDADSQSSVNQWEREESPHQLRLEMRLDGQATSRFSLLVTPWTSLELAP